MARARRPPLGSGLQPHQHTALLMGAGLLGMGLLIAVLGGGGGSLDCPPPCHIEWPPNQGKICVCPTPTP